VIPIAVATGKGGSCVGQESLSSLTQHLTDARVFSSSPSVNRGQGCSERLKMYSDAWIHGMSTASALSAYFEPSQSHPDRIMSVQELSRSHTVLPGHISPASINAALELQSQRSLQLAVVILKRAAVEDIVDAVYARRNPVESIWELWLAVESHSDDVYDLVATVEDRLFDAGVTGVFLRVIAHQGRELASLVPSDARAISLA